jgi:hypothetical protein
MNNTWFVVARFTTETEIVKEDVESNRYECIDKLVSNTDVTFLMRKEGKNRRRHKYSTFMSDQLQTITSDEKARN